MKETIDLLGQAVTKLQAVQLLQKQGQHVSKQVEGEALLQVRQVAKRVRRHPKFGNMMQKDLYDVLGSLERVGARNTGS